MNSNSDFTENQIILKKKPQDYFLGYVREYKVKKTERKIKMYGKQIQNVYVNDPYLTPYIKIHRRRQLDS